MLQQKAFSSHAAQRSCFTRVNLSVFARESRIGMMPIPIPKGVNVTITGQHLKVKADGILRVAKNENTRLGMSQHGLTRSLANNMVVGVSTGFQKKMEMIGTGYRASVAGKELTLNVGYSKPRLMAVPEGLTVTVEKNTGLTISGADKVAVGDFCASIRRQREPEPYKGKGIRYAGEVIKLKEGKGGKKK